MTNISGPLTLIKKSVAIFFKKDNFFYLLKVNLLLILLEFFFVGNPSLLTRLSEGKNGFLAGVFYLIFFLVFSWASVTTLFAWKSVLSGSLTPLWSVLSLGFRSLWRFSLLLILTYILLFISYILFIVPGVILSVWFYFAPYILVDRGAGVFASFSQSRKLVRRRFWKVLWRIFVIGMCSLFLSFVVSFIPFSLGGIISPLIAVFFVLPGFLLYQELVSSGETV